MEDSIVKYRLSSFRMDSSIIVDIKNLPNDILDKIPPFYFVNYRYITIEGEVDIHTYVILIPVKKFRKNETVVELSGISIGLDDDY